MTASPIPVATPTIGTTRYDVDAVTQAYPDTNLLVVTAPVGLVVRYAGYTFYVRPGTLAFSGPARPGAAEVTVWFDTRQHAPRFSVDAAEVTPIGEPLARAFAHVASSWRPMHELFASDTQGNVHRRAQQMEQSFMLAAMTGADPRLIREALDVDPCDG